MRKANAILCLIVPLFAVTGCAGGEAGPKTMRVWGDVSYDGKPIEEGTIDFVSTDGSPPAQAPIKAGHYDLPTEAGPVADKTYQVRISALAKTGKSVPNLMPGGGDAMEPLYNTIPAEYNSKSTLTASISPDASKNQFDFNLKKGAVPKR
jgi:hypothetical protein